MLLEVCCENIGSVSIAAQCGADRIELCTALELGGLRPGIDFIKAAQDICELPLMILIRPRGGDFKYTALEKKLILREIESALALNVEGIVFGALTADRNLDIEFLKIVSDLASKVSFTFHRAFDFLVEPLPAIDVLVDLGVDRILTSGQAASAAAGMDNIKEFIDVAQGRIAIMPGAGINSENLRSIIEATSVSEIHLSAKKKISNTKSGDPFTTDYYLTDKEELEWIQKILS